MKKWKINNLIIYFLGSISIILVFYDFLVNIDTIIKEDFRYSGGKL